MEVFNSTNSSVIFEFDLLRDEGALYNSILAYAR